MKTPRTPARPLKIAVTAWLATWLTAASFCATAQDRPKPPAPRGNVSIEATSNAETLRVEKDRPPIARDFTHQPPLIPHSVKGYNITKNFNQCMDCHSPARHKETHATKLSESHFRGREGKELANISPQRYFCTQCHVPQIEIKPLVANTFKRAEGMRQAQPARTE